MPEMIRTEMISQQHDDLLAGYFGINKTRKLVARKYYWKTLFQDVKSYIQGCNIYLTSKVVKHKRSDNLQSLPILTHCWKNLLIDFVTGLSNSID